MGWREILRTLCGADRHQGCTGGETAAMKELFDALPAVLRYWMDLEITFYRSRPGNLVVVMDTGDYYEVLYSGVTEESFTALREAMAGLGEPI